MAQDALGVIADGVIAPISGQGSEADEAGSNGAKEWVGFYDDAAALRRMNFPPHGPIAELEAAPVEDGGSIGLGTIQAGLL